MAVKKSAVQTLYHVEDGPQSMPEIDTHHALRFKDEWSKTPWNKDGKPTVAEREREIADLEQRLARLRSIAS
jgi:hypothetical protein